MGRRYPLLVILLALSAGGYVFSPVSAEAQPLQIIGIAASPTQPYDKPLNAYITVSHNPGVNATTSIFYQLLLNQTTPQGGWRVSNGRATFSSATSTVFVALIPNPFYNENLQYNMKIVFYAEATDSQGHVALSTDPKARWDPLAQGDKSVTIVTDPYPPTISDITLSPPNPTSNDRVTVAAKAEGSSSGVRQVSLYYSVDDSPMVTIEMSRTPPADLYEGVIPAQEKGRTVSYYLVATNNAGNRKISSKATYTISPTAQETLTQRAFYFALVALAAGLVAAGLTLSIRNRLRRQPPSRVILPTEPKHPRMLASTTLAILIVVAWLSYNIWSVSTLSNKWFCVGLAMLFLLFLCAVDPRLHCFIPGPPALKNLLSWFSRPFDEHPPLLFAAAAVLLFVTSTIVATLGYFLNLLIFRGLLGLNIDVLAITEGTTLLFGAGIGFELVWSMFRKGIVGVSLEKGSP